jgi:ATP-dependent exoDNAse (exonuclease V) alpha subunit
MGPGSITIRLDGEPKRGFFQIKPTTITIDLKKYPDVQLGYAATTHKVQGITVEQSFVLMGDSMRNKEMAFTQLSRASHHTTLYAARTGSDSPLERLAHDISKSIAKDLAHDHKVVKQRTHGHDRGLSL